MKKKTIGLFAVLLLTSAGCGYHVVGKPEVSTGLRANGLVGGIKTISIPYFNNETQRPDVEGVVTNAFVNEFVNTVDIVDRLRADAVLEGVIKKYSLKPISFSGADVVREYRLIVIMSVRLVRTSDRKVLWQDDEAGDDDEFDVVPDDVAATKDAEWQALSGIAFKTARRVKERILAGD
ncbi:MAG: LptE family protein [Deltaproteobacteria bacterium]|nr:LptE family protein [Deltaproteobacteria bacterium]